MNWIKVFLICRYVTTYLITHLFNYLFTYVLRSKLTSFWRPVLLCLSGTPRSLVVERDPPSLGDFGTFSGSRQWGSGRGLRYRNEEGKCPPGLSNKKRRNTQPLYTKMTVVPQRLLSVYHRLHWTSFCMFVVVLIYKKEGHHKRPSYTLNKRQLCRILLCHVSSWRFTHAVSNMCT